MPLPNIFLYHHRHQRLADSHKYVLPTSIALPRLLTTTKRILPVAATSYLSTSTDGPSKTDNRIRLPRHRAAPTAATAAVPEYPTGQHDTTATVSRRASLLVPYPLGGCSSRRIRVQHHQRVDSCNEDESTNAQVIAVFSNTMVFYTTHGYNPYPWVRRLHRYGVHRYGCGMTRAHPRCHPCYTSTWASNIL